MKIAFLFLAFIVGGGVQAQHFKQHILFLASDSLHGRAPGTADEKKAANYIAAQFDSAGCKVVFQKFHLILPAQNRGMKQNPSAKENDFNTDSAINVFGFLNFKKDSTIIISAHYDHLGYGSNKSKEIIKKGIHHGADDNASGVAMIIELSQFINHQSSITSQKYNFLFAAYSAHEAGLFGSAYFSKSKMCTSLKIRAVINFDMVGRLDAASKTVRISGAETDSAFHTFFQQQHDSVFHFRFDDENIPLSDLKPFAEKGIAVLNITTGIHDDYHRISDTEDKINYEGLNGIYRLAKKMLPGLNK